MNAFNRTFIAGLLAIGIAFVSLTAHAAKLLPLSITNVLVAPDVSQVIITGVNLDNGDPPVVELGGVGPLAVTDATANMIEATLPAGPRVATSG